MAMRIELIALIVWRGNTQILPANQVAKTVAMADISHKQEKLVVRNVVLVNLVPFRVKIVARQLAKIVTEKHFREGL